MNDITITLIKAKDLIKKEENWTQYQLFGQDQECMCSLGALYKAVHKNISYQSVMAADNDPDFNNAKKFLEKTIGGNIAAYNDHPRRTHKEILEMFDDAILKSISPWRYRLKKIKDTLKNFGA